MALRHFPLMVCASLAADFDSSDELGVDMRPVVRTRSAALADIEQASDFSELLTHAGRAFTYDRAHWGDSLEHAYFCYQAWLSCAFIQTAKPWVSYRISARKQAFFSKSQLTTASLWAAKQLCQHLLAPLPEQPNTYPVHRTASGTPPDRPLFFKRGGIKHRTRRKVSSHLPWRLTLCLFNAEELFLKQTLVQLLSRLNHHTQCMIRHQPRRDRTTLTAYQRHLELEPLDASSLIGPSLAHLLESPAECLHFFSAPVPPSWSAFESHLVFTETTAFEPLLQVGFQAVSVSASRSTEQLTKLSHELHQASMALCTHIGLESCTAGLGRLRIHLTPDSRSAEASFWSDRSTLSFYHSAHSLYHEWIHAAEHLTLALKEPKSTEALHNVHQQWHTIPQDSKVFEAMIHANQLDHLEARHLCAMDLEEFIEDAPKEPWTAEDLQRITQTLYDGIISRANLDIERALLWANEQISSLCKAEHTWSEALLKQFITTWIYQDNILKEEALILIKTQTRGLSSFMAFAFFMDHFYQKQKDRPCYWLKPAELLARASEAYFCTPSPLSPIDARPPLSHTNTPAFLASQPIAAFLNPAFDFSRPQSHESAAITPFIHHWLSSLHPLLKAGSFGFASRKHS